MLYNLLLLLLLLLLLQANGEGNNDGTNDNFSWNCGHEGHTENGGVLDMRYKQMRNYLVALMMAIGTPMMVMGEWRFRVWPSL
jgi:pullulanase/glycogen debranching enzyme